MIDAVERRKEKFRRLGALRQIGPEALAGKRKKREEGYGPKERIKDICDEGSFQEFHYEFSEINPLGFNGYEEKKKLLREKAGTEEGVVSGTCRIGGYPAVLAVMNKQFLMGSMGIELGERIARAAEEAEKRKLPLIIFTCSGGARMQEGILGLFQMAKTAAVIERFKEKGGLYIAILTHPTTGGVSASFAALGDITLAEPEALIGFAGPRVIRQTIGAELPEGFQRAEFLEEHGFLDAVVPRAEMKARLTQLLMLHRIDAQ